MKRPLVALILATATAACRGPTEPPKTLLDADRAKLSPAVIETQTSAPQAKASADALRDKAWKLADEGHIEEASVVAEQASAAYELAIALGRRSRATERVEKASELITKKKLELSSLEADQARLEGEIEALELRARVQEDQQGIGDVAKLTPERAQARRRAAFVLLREAEALCVGSRLLGVDDKELGPMETELKLLGDRLERGSQERDVFPESSSLRARCLKLLTNTRVQSSLQAPEAADNDVLLEEASALELPAERDDRGIVVKLTDILDGKELSARTQAELTKIGKLASAHREFPLLLVVHTAGQTESKAPSWGDAAQAALVKSGASSVRLLFAGSAAPLVDRRSAGAATLNRRLEAVFVSPRL